MPPIINSGKLFASHPTAPHSHSSSYEESAMQYHEKIRETQSLVVRIRALLGGQRDAIDTIGEILREI